MKSIKIKIYPNKKQKELLEKHFGSCRFAYNFGLNLKIKQYTENKKHISCYEIQKEITKLKKEKEWLKEVNSQSLQQSIHDLDSAFVSFFKKNNKFPKFKGKYNSKQSFHIPQHFEVNPKFKNIKIPKIKYIHFRDKFNVPVNVEFRSMTISREGNNYFSSILYDDKLQIPKQKPVEEDKTLGIDLGIKTLAILSNGEKIENPKHFKKYEDKLSEEQRKLSLKTDKTTNSYKKQKNKVYKIHQKISNSRKDFLHKLTKNIVENQNYTSFCMEDLAVKQMQQTNYSPMARAIGDAGWRMMKTFMEYKCSDLGKNLITIGRFDKSSQTCCVCGHIYKELQLDEREWICSSCNTKHDRDINASKNIRNFGLIKSLGKDFSESLEPHLLR